jgi:hypothetical protein
MINTVRRLFILRIPTNQVVHHHATLNRTSQINSISSCFNTNSTTYQPIHYRSLTNLPVNERSELINM